MVHLTQDRLHVAERAVVTLSQPASILAAEATLDDALHVLLNAGLKHLVVVAPGGRFVGVLEGRQIVAAWAGSPDTLSVTPVTALLDAVPPIVAPTATARTVACVMRDYGSDVVVVVGQDRTPVGVVTARDLVAAIADSH